MRDKFHAMVSLSSHNIYNSLKFILQGLERRWQQGVPVECHAVRNMWRRTSSYRESSSLCDHAKSKFENVSKIDGEICAYRSD